MPITTTLNRIWAHGPCEDRWHNLLRGLGKEGPDDDPLPFAQIVEINGFDDALWCCRAEPQYARDWLLYAVWCARQVAHLMTDERSLRVLDVAERHARGNATDEELVDARVAARDAATNATGDSARAAAWAARAAEDSAWAAAWVAGAVGDSAWAARAAARAAATNAAEDSAWAAARDAQRERFIGIVNASMENT